MEVPDPFETVLDTYNRLAEEVNALRRALEPFVPEDGSADKRSFELGMLYGSQRVLNEIGRTIISSTHAADIAEAAQAIADQAYDDK